MTAFTERCSQVHERVNDPPCQVAAESAYQHFADVSASGLGHAQRTREGEHHDQAEPDFGGSLDWAQNSRVWAKLFGQGRHSAALECHSTQFVWGTRLAVFVVGMRIVGGHR